MWRSLLPGRRLSAQVAKSGIRSPSLGQAFLWTKALPGSALRRPFSNTHQQTKAVNEQTKDNFPVLDVRKSLDDWLRKVVTAVNTYPHSANLRVKPLGHICVYVLGMRQGGMTIGVKLHRSSRGNSLNSEILVNLKQIFDLLGQHEWVNGVCLLPSQGSTFCGGADTFEMSNLKTPHDAESFIQKISDVCNSIRNIPVPVVALIRGPCLGAGLELVASCDIRVCTERSSFSMPEVLVHLPSVVQARLLCDIVGWGRARHLIFTGATWSAQEAFQAGLVTQTFQTPSEMTTWAHEYVAQLNDPAVRNQYRAQKRLINGWETQAVDEGIEAGVKCFSDHFAQADIGRSVSLAVFTEKQKRKAKSVGGSAGDFSQLEQGAGKVSEAIERASQDTEEAK